MLAGSPKPTAARLQPDVSNWEDKSLGEKREKGKHSCGFWAGALLVFVAAFVIFLCSLTT